MSAGWFLVVISLVAAAQSNPGGGGFRVFQGKEFFNPNVFKVQINIIYISSLPYINFERWIFAMF